MNRCNELVTALGEPRRRAVGDCADAPARKIGDGNRPAGGEPAGQRGSPPQRIGRQHERPAALAERDQRDACCCWNAAPTRSNAAANCSTHSPTTACWHAALRWCAVRTAGRCAHAAKVNERHAPRHRVLRRERARAGGGVDRRARGQAAIDFAAETAYPPGRRRSRAGQPVREQSGQSRQYRQSQPSGFHERVQAIMFHRLDGDRMC